MKEHSCIVPDSYKYKFPYDFVDHVTFNKFNYQEKNIYQCKKCSLIFLKRKNFHIDSKTIGRQNIPTYKSLAEILKKNINFSAFKILDVGCYDGKLLKELSKIVKNLREMAT